MLHIILVILKIIGILLAAVLGLIVLGILLVLFVPLSYQLDFERGTGKDFVQGRFGWLARLIMVRARLEGGKPHVTVRILGFTKQLLPAVEKKAKAGKRGSGGKKPKTVTGDDGRRKLPAETEKTVKTESQAGPEQSGKMESQAKAEGSGKTESHTETVESGKTEVQAEPQQSGGEASQTKPEKSGKAESRTEREQSNQESQANTEVTLRQAGKSGKSEDSGKRPGILKKIRGLYIKIKSAVLKIYGILIHIPEIPGRLLKKWKGVQNKAEAVKKKAEHYMSMWKDEGTQAVFMLSKDQIRFLWRHLHPRKIQGKLRYGFEDPSITGMVTGGLYLILPMSFYEVELLPEFEPDKPLILEGKLLIKGHVRLCHLAKTAWILFRNKDLRKLLKQLKA